MSISFEEIPSDIQRIGTQSTYTEYAREQTVHEGGGDLEAPSTHPQLSLTEIPQAARDPRSPSDFKFHGAAPSAMTSSDTPASVNGPVPPIKQTVNGLTNVHFAAAATCLTQTTTLKWSPTLSAKPLNAGASFSMNL